MLNRKFGVELEFGLRRDPVAWRRMTGLNREDHSQLHDYLLEPRRMGAVVRRLFVEGDFSSDGSGVEFSTPILTWRKWPAFARAVEILHRLPTYTTSHDGLHVHHDVREASEDEIFNLLRFWMRHQSVVYNLVGSGRRRGWAARPVTSTSAVDALRSWKLSPEKYFERYYPNSDYFLRTSRNLRKSQFTCILNRMDRYRGLNLISVNNYGSVEFRLHEGTLDLSKIRRWVRFTQVFVERGLEYTGPLKRAEPDELVQEVGKSAFTGGLLSRLYDR